MAEKMLVTQGLDERDLLVKKIGDKIKKMKIVDVKKRNEEKTVDTRETQEEFGKNAQAAFQQIMDLIDRYRRLDAAIIESNAANWVETSYGKFTVASAIALRARLKGDGIYREDGAFEDTLAEALETQYNAAVRAAESRNKLVESQAENMRLSILGKDAKGKDIKPLEVVDAYIRENTTEVIDPLEAQKKHADLLDRIDTLLSELDTRIKVSNATTMIEF